MGVDAAALLAGRARRAGAQRRPTSIRRGTRPSQLAATLGRRRARRPRQGSPSSSPASSRRSGSGSSSSSPSRSARTAPASCPIVGEPLGRPGGLRRRPPLPRRRSPIDAPRAAGHPALVGGSDASPHGLGHMVVTLELADRPHRRRPRRPALRPARRRRGQGGHRPRCSTRAAPTSPAQPLGDLLDQRPARRPPRPPGLRRPGRPRGRTCSRRPAWRCATGCAWPRPSASARGSSTRPASSTRAGRATIVFVQVVGDDPHEIPIPGQPLRLRPPEAGPGRRRPPHARRRARHPRPAASTSHDARSDGRRR